MSFKEDRTMQNIIFAATVFGYCVQVIKNAVVIYEYTAGNCWNESQAVIAPKSPGAAKPSQIKRWAVQTAKEIASERGIPLNQVEYDLDLETSLKENLDFFTLPSITAVLLDERSEP
jgi:hypothetical protein